MLAEDSANIKKELDIDCVLERTRNMLADSVYDMSLNILYVHKESIDKE